MLQSGTKATVEGSNCEQVARPLDRSELSLFGQTQWSGQTCSEEGIALLLPSVLREQETARSGNGDPSMMKPSTRDNVEGTVREVNGNIKETAGKLIKDPKLENAGKREKTLGKGQKINAGVEKSIGE
jgi:uncharacterized protein YjbJ (UPF0337 family)